MPNRIKKGFNMNFPGLSPGESKWPQATNSSAKLLASQSYFGVINYIIPAWNE